MPDQCGIPVIVTPAEIAREVTLGGAIELCLKAAGYQMDKQAAGDLGADKAQFSRWQSGTEGILWPKLARLMAQCGNDAPVRWMVHQQGYELASLHKRETDLERENRELRQKLEQIERERAVELRLYTKLRSA